MKRNALLLLASGLACARALADTTAPPTPQNVNLEFNSCHTVTVKWDPVVDASTGFSATSGLKEYVIYRRRPGLPDEAVVWTKGTPPDRILLRRHATNLIGGWPESTITVGVQAVDNAGNASGIQFAQMQRPGLSSPMCQDQTPPTKPTLTVESLGCRGALVRAQGGGSGVTAYQYFRDETRFAGTPGLPLGQGDDVVGPVPGQSYAYRIKAVDAAGNVSVYSDPVTHTVPSCAGPSNPPRVAIIAGYLPGRSLQHSFPTLKSVVWGDESTQTKTRNLYDFMAEISDNRLIPLRSIAHEAGPLALPGQPQDYGCTSQQENGNWQGCNTFQIERELLRLAGWTGSEADRWIFFVGGVNNVGSAGGNGVFLGANRPTDSLAHTLAHEYLHTYGLQHSAARRFCPGYGSSSIDGSGAGHLGPVQSDPTFGCDYYDYGDGYSIMGTGTDMYHPPIFMKQLLGLVQPEQIHLATNEDANVFLGSVTGSSYPLRQLLLKRTLGYQAAWYSMELRSSTGFNGPLGGGNLAPFVGLQIREILQKPAGDGVQTVVTAQIPLVKFQQRAYYDPVNRFGVILTGYTTAGAARVTLCGMQSDCPAWVLATSPWAN